MNRESVLVPPGVRFRFWRRRPSGPSAPARPDLRLRQGKALVVAGWITAMVGVLIYCVASFAAGADVDLTAILLHGAVPAARVGLIVVGVGTLVWFVGSVVHLNAALDLRDSGPIER